MNLKNIEEEYEKFELEERKSYGNRYENEIRYNKIEKELEDAKMELKNFKKLYSQSFTNNDLKLSDKLGRTIFLEKQASNYNQNLNKNDRFVLKREMENQDLRERENLDLRDNRENRENKDDRNNSHMINNQKKEDEDGFICYKASSKMTQEQQPNRIVSFDFKR